jgi:hypothetical protein
MFIPTASEVTFRNQSYQAQHYEHCGSVFPLLPQTYLLKLQRSGEDGYKTFLLMESGQRFHTTQVCACMRNFPPGVSCVCLDIARDSVCTSVTHSAFRDLCWTSASHRDGVPYAACLQAP